MSAQNAIQLATAIQSKVGSSLISANSLLPRDEAAGTMVQAGASSLGVFLLRDLYDMQQKTYNVRLPYKFIGFIQDKIEEEQDEKNESEDDPDIEDLVSNCNVFGKSKLFYFYALNHLY